MKIIEAKKKDLNLKEWVKRSAKEEDYETLIDEPCVVTVDGQIKIIYDHLDIDTSDVQRALRKIKYTTGKRSRGLVSTSRIFGYRPRNEMRQDYCSSTSLAVEHPKEHEIVARLATKLEKYYQKHNPEQYQKHKAESEGKIKEAWRIHGENGEESIYTSGIINKNNPLKYHFDTGNFTDVYSMMIVFKEDVEGGYLSVPELGLGFKLPNNSVFMFDGQGMLHGVTPIKKQTKDAYRFSVVYYTLKRMWQCLEITEEIARIRQKKTERERTRLAKPLTEEEAKLKAQKEKMLKDRLGKQ